MKLSKKVLAGLLVLVLMLCLLPTAALAAPHGRGDRDAAPETTDAAETETPQTPDPENDTEDAEEPDLDEELEDAITAVEEQTGEDVLNDEMLPEEDVIDLENVEPEDAEEPEEEDLLPEPEATFCEEGDVLYAKSGDLVYNNGGTVYSNAATVYNNGGLVYNNGGLVYNNAGTVYANGGVVYNNGGLVYNNGAVVYAFGGDVETSLIAGYYRVTLSEDYSAFAQIEGLEAVPGEDDALMMAEDAVVTITPAEGFTVASASAEGAKLAANEDGSYSLTAPEAAVTLTLSFRTAAPVFSLAEGTYAEAQSLELTAVEGASVYYTLDGELPDEDNCVLYEEPIALEEGAVVTAVAVVEGTEASEPAVASYAIVAVTAPTFEPVEVGYSTPAAQPVAIENPGAVVAHVESVELSGEQADSFTLNRGTSGRVAAEATNDSTWTIRPAAKLEAGTYTALLTVTFDSGAVYETEISFEVAQPAAEEAEETAEEADAAEAEPEDGEPAEEVEEAVEEAEETSAVK
ncbi:MAG: chitobiase/beta-hexosaminidase C-terminal domain-containing protein [Oscillospiraceae bacterium]|nr:chitobiase/beta-hexosaminidase C-terminal domain-containing protein [Oscillospiraceae bacterium]